MTAAEIATLDCVTWWGMKRLHKVLGHRIPAEAEASYTHPKTTAPATVLPRNETPGASVRVWFSARSDPIDRASTKLGAIQAVGSSEVADLLTTSSVGGEQCCELFGVANLST